MYNKLFMTLVVSWIFMRSTYSDMPPVRPHVEALPETHYYFYNRQQTNLRGINGSNDTYIQVQRGYK